MKLFHGFNSIKKIEIDFLDLKLNIEPNSSGSLSMGFEDIRFYLALLKEDFYRPEEKYRHLSQYLSDTEEIDWKLFLGDVKYKEYMLYIRDKMKILFDKKIANNYIEIFGVRKKLTSSLTRVMIDGEPSSLSVYRHDTPSGRHTIESGTNWLTMTKETKSNSLSTSDNSTVLVEIDFNAFEPSFYMSSQLSWNGCKQDPYEWIKDELNLSAERKDLKVAIISTLYGAKHTTLPSEQMREIRDFLQIKNFERQLIEENQKQGFIYNAWGRPVFGSESLISKWNQSSSADFSHLAFYDFLSKEENSGIRPVALIHDAMIAEVPRDDLQRVLAISELSEEISKKSLAVKVKELSSS